MKKKTGLLFAVILFPLMANALPRVLLNNSGLKVEHPLPNSLVAYKTPMKVYSNVNGFVLSIKDCVIVNSKINGSVFTILGNIKVRRKSKINGNVIAVFGRVIVEKGAYIKGVSFGVNRKLISSNYFLFPLIYAAFILLILPFEFFFKENMIYLEVYIRRRSWESLFLGLFYLFMTVVTLVMLLLTIIGNFILPLIIPLLAISFFISLYTVAGLIGSFIRATLREQPFIEKIVGLALLTVLLYIPFGDFLFTILLIMGYGSALKNRFGFLPI